MLNMMINANSHINLMDIRLTDLKKQKVHKVNPVKENGMICNHPCYTHCSKQLDFLRTPLKWVLI